MFPRDQIFLNESVHLGLAQASSGPPSLGLTPASISILETISLASSWRPAISRYLGDSGTENLRTAANRAGRAPTKNAARHP